MTLFETSLAKYDEAAAESGFDNDMAGALSMLFLARERLTTGKDLPEGSDQKLALQLQAVLDTAAVANLADRDKQAVFEWAISTTAILLTIQEQVAQTGGDPEHKLAAAVDDLIGDVFGVPGNQLTIGADGLKATRTAPVASGDFVQLAAVSATGHAAVRAAILVRLHRRGGEARQCGAAVLGIELRVQTVGMTLCHTSRSVGWRRWIVVQASGEVALSAA